MLLALGGVVLALAILVRAPGPDRSMRQFDPDRVADLEVDMWKAYYAKQRPRLVGLLILTLREQFHYSWLTAARAAFHLGRAATTFGDIRDNYERVLPDLEHGYEIARDWTGEAFDPATVARDELGWWVARRDPATAAPQMVGDRMTQLYADLYAIPRQRVTEAALLRAQAGDLRDRGGAGADWTAVAGLLQRSYRSLRAAIAPP